MGIDLRGSDIGMAQQFLHRTKVLTCLKQVGGKGMSEGMTADPFIHDTCLFHRHLQRLARD